MSAAKLDRAKELVDELQNEISAFFKKDPFKIGFVRDEKTKVGKYVVTKADPLPKRVQVLAGDIFQNLRSALDHAMYDIFLKAGGDQKDAKDVFFPIADSQSRYIDIRSRKIFSILKPDTLALLDGIRPYKEGNLTLWQLHKLNNIDKHRLLVAAGTAFKNMDIAPHVKNILGMALPVEGIFIEPANQKIPLEVGDELFIGAPGEEPNKELNFNFNISLSERGIIEGKNLLQTTRNMVNQVDTVLVSLGAINRSSS